MKFKFKKNNKEKAELNKDFSGIEISNIDLNTRSQIKFRTAVPRTDGFALLFAVIVSVILLAVGSSIISIALKEINLSGTGRDSQYAFYAANTGIECATFWDLNAGRDDSTTIFNPFPNEEGDIVFIPGAKCGGNNQSPIFLLDEDGNSGNGNSEPPQQTIADYDLGDGVTRSYNIVRFRFSVDYGDSNDPCVDVIVNKVMSSDPDSDPNAEILKTIIESRGFNRCDRSNPRTTQRGLDIRY